MGTDRSKCRQESPGSGPALRCGFSTGTAATAATLAALRCLITGISTDVTAVRLPSGIYLATPVASCQTNGSTARASVVKEGGDDPDVTNGAEIRARVALFCRSHQEGGGQRPDSRIVVLAGRGIGTVTKPGLPVLPGEPAINPVPRRMLSENITLELLRCDPFVLEAVLQKSSQSGHTGLEWERAQTSGGKASVRLPLYEASNPDRLFTLPHEFLIQVEIEAPKGEELARHTLNPRLGITGGISILGTTGIVKPFSHEAYEQTIQAAFSVAASNCPGTAVLSTGGKSERYAKQRFPDLAPEAFIQIADFFSFSVGEAVRFGFSTIVHSVFFGKAVKMAIGHPYTHAHAASMDLEFLAQVARGLGHTDNFCRELASANTARHALEIIAAKGACDIVESIARKAAQQSERLCGRAARIRLLLFDYDGKLLAEVGEK